MTMTDVEMSVGSTVGWLTVCSLAQLEPLWAEAALLRGQQIAIVLLPDGNVHAVTNQDPATGSFVMSRGIVGSRGDRTTIASPLHKQVYDLVTGECYTTPEFSLRTFDVRIENGVVQVWFDASDVWADPTMEPA